MYKRAPRPEKIRSRGYLPHWEKPGATYAVTFRLVDSLPQSVLDAYLLERQGILDTAEQMHRPLSPQERDRLAELFSERIDAWLDRGVGSCYLRQPDVAKVVFDSVKHFHGSRYNLHTWCVMPNHVHVLVTPQSPHGLDDIVHSWKSYSAKEANRILGRTGSFWMREYYDHIIRDRADHEHAHRYILANPSQGNLSDWPWVASLETL